MPIFALGHADRVEQVRVSGDVHRLHVGEGGQHHLDLGRLEHAAVFVVVAILHLDVGLGEEAEDLREQVALMVGELLRPVAAILAQRHFLGHPVDLLLALPDSRTPRGIRTACTACGLREGASLLAPENSMTRRRGCGADATVMRHRSVPLPSRHGPRAAAAAMTKATAIRRSRVAMPRRRTVDRDQAATHGDRRADQVSRASTADRAEA